MKAFLGSLLLLVVSGCSFDRAGGAGDARADAVQAPPADAPIASFDAPPPPDAPPPDAPLSPDAPSWTPPPTVPGTDTPSTPSFQALHPEGVVWADFFGSAVAISPDGHTIAVAAINDGYYPNYQPRGSVYLFEEDLATGQFARTAHLQVADAYGFGTALALDGAHLAVAATDHDGATGAAIHTYERDPTLGWVPRTVLTSPVAPAGQFGHCLAFDGPRLLACGTDFVASFERTPAGDWHPAHLLIPPVPQQQPGGFGSSIAVDGDTLVIGDTTAGTDGFGAALVYARGGATGWQFTQVLPPTDSWTRSVGWRVAIAGDRIAVTAIAWPESVDIWERSAGSWAPTAHLTAYSSQSDYWEFGNAIALSGDQVLVGTGTWSNPLQTDPGHVYAFRHGAAGWSGDGQVVMPDLALQDNYGVAIAAAGGRIAIGADTNDLTCPGNADCNAGTVYVYAAP